MEKPFGFLLSQGKGRMAARGGFCLSCVAVLNYG